MTSTMVKNIGKNIVAIACTGISTPGISVWKGQIVDISDGWIRLVTNNEKFSLKEVYLNLDYVVNIGVMKDNATWNGPRD